MHLLAVVLILIVWAVYGLVKTVQPPNPHIEDMDEHLKYIQSLPSPAARRKYLRDRARQSRRNIK